MREKYGEWAVVTGASSGIGKAFAYHLAALKINIILVSNEKERLEAVSGDIELECEVETISCCVDLSDGSSYEKVIACSEGKEAGMLINSAAYGMQGDFHEGKLDDFLNLIDLNIKAYVALTHYFLQGMVTRNKGAVIILSSLNAISPIGKSAVYTSTKAFDLYFGGAIWHEMQDKNIDILTIMPGATRTEFQKRAGTHVNSMALDPEALVTGALDCLGKKMVYIPGLHNKLISFLASNVDMEKRVIMASKIYQLMLNDKPDADLFQLLAELDFL